MFRFCTQVLLVKIDTMLNLSDVILNTRNAAMIVIVNI
jgi:hypothetical protein